MIVLRGVDGVRAAAGEELGVSGWHSLSQIDVDRFADVTGDHQWIHVDTERAATGPFGRTIVHGYFTVALAPKLAEEVYAFEGFAYGVNYGLNRVRFPAPLPVGEPVRMRVVLASVEDVPGGVQVVMTETFERDGEAKPVCVAEAVFRLYS